MMPTMLHDPIFYIASLHFNPFTVLATDVSLSILCFDFNFNGLFLYLFMFPLCLT